MNDVQRQALCEQIVKSWLDSCDLKDLERFFYDAQLESLLSSTDEEILEHATDLELTVN